MFQKTAKTHRFRPEIPTGEVKEISGINSEESNVEKYLCVCQNVNVFLPIILLSSLEKKILEAETNHQKKTVGYQFLMMNQSLPRQWVGNHHLLSLLNWLFRVP